MKITNNIWFKIFFSIIVILISYKVVRTCISYYKLDEYSEVYQTNERIIKNEQKYYNTLIRKNYNNQNYNIPYIPEGFTHVEGEWDSGYVIEDSFKNQFVWVPCINRNINNVPILKRKNFAKDAFIKYDECNNISYVDFIKSSLENCGFYISRYEIGKENNKPVSKEKVKIWTIFNQDDVIQISKKMYERDDIKTELINGYAYDTTLEWIKAKNDIEMFNIQDEEIISGRNEYNNIYDFTDNVLELSQELNIDTAIVRGFSANDFLDELEDYSWREESRYPIISQYESDNEGIDKLAFRIILYR